MKKENPEARYRSKQRKKRGFVPYLIFLFVLSFVLFISAGVSLFLYYSHHLPDFKPLKDRNLNANSVIYSEEDEVVGKILLENRMPIAYDRIPKLLIHAFVAAEDAEFFHH